MKETDRSSDGLVACVDSMGSILLQSVRANITSIGGDKNVRTQILFDSGSPRKYITSNVRKHLNLKTLRTKKVIIKTFGSYEPRMKILDVVQFKVESCYDVLHVSTDVCTHIILNS